MSFIYFSYKKSDFKYDNFIHLNENDLLEVLRWRNSFNTRKFMKNKNPISKRDHLLYCENLKKQNISAYWRLSYSNRYIGVICVNQYFPEKNSCEWGFYLSDQNLPEDSLTIFYAALKLFFEINSISILHGSVMTINKSAVLLNFYFQFIEVESKIINGENYLILKLERQNWINRKITLNQLISNFFMFYKQSKLKNANS
jgi:UDP-4-amino-4,6-dideoxy-N-acetyl-beta-L-altrosamine N-acetyltransferase